MGEIDRLFGGLDRPVSRRELLRRAGRGSMFLGAMALLAACGVEAQRREGSDRLEPLPAEPAGQLVMANWPLYIDKGPTGSPTVKGFESEFGIDMKYDVVINDNEEFFGTIREPLSQGQSTGWDIVVLTDWMIAKMNRLGYLERLHHEELPTFEANVADKFRDPWFDPGNEHSIPWAAGITGIGYDVEAVGRDIVRFEDLFAEDLAGRIGLFAEMRDTFGLALASMGIQSPDATVEDVQAAQQMLIANRDKVRGFYGNDYTDGMARGDLVASMAWSGDIFALSLDNPNLRFVIPEAGGMRWSDNMVIPIGAEHPLDAHLFMNHVYDPRIATNITEWVWYESPVAAVQEMIRADAAGPDADDLSCSPFCAELAEDRFVFPTEETNAQTIPYKQLDEEEETAWNDLFQTVVQG
ncbi:MAG: polyamine ABC transporter substrate-binding protein [Actinomycetota bacterium]